MADAYARYTGQRVGVSFSFPFGWGVRPSVCSITTTENVGALPPVGRLDLFFRGGRLSFPDARLASLTAPRSTGGGGLLELFIQDRRWKWQFGAIDGDYNKTGQSGKLIREKTPQELARLLFAAIGEPDADYQRLPNDARPRRSWQAANAGIELDSLCAELGCVVTLNPLTDRAEVHRIGEGADLPTGGNRIATVPGIDILPIPDQIRVVTGPALFETTLKLGAALGIETDGSLQPIDSLSYKPAAGWAQENPNQFAGVTGDYTDPATGKTAPLRNLALAGVYRLYKITGQDAGGWSPEALKESAFEPKSLDDLLPILNFRLAKSGDGLRLPPLAAGVFADARKQLTNTAAGTPVDANFQIDGARGVVRFGEPVFKRVGVGAEFTVAPADLTLRAAYSVNKEGVIIRHDRFRNRDGPTYGAGVRLERHSELQREVIELAGDDSDNQQEIDQAADYYLDAINAQYADRSAETAAYPGLLNASPDGAIRRVVWSGSVAAPPTTIVSRNAEPNPFVPPWEATAEHRARREVEHLLADRARLPL